MKPNNSGENKNIIYVLTASCIFLTVFIIFIWGYFALTDETIMNSLKSQTNTNKLENSGETTINQENPNPEIPYGKAGPDTYNGGSGGGSSGSSGGGSSGIFGVTESPKNTLTGFFSKFITGKAIEGPEGQIIYYNDGYVGIGTAEPTAKLDVNGTIKAGIGSTFGNPTTYFAVEDLYINSTTYGDLGYYPMIAAYGNGTYGNIGAIKNQIILYGEGSAPIITFINKDPEIVGQIGINLEASQFQMSLPLQLTSLNASMSIRARDYYSRYGSRGKTDSSSFWLCTNEDCSSKCRPTFENGLLIKCD